MADSRCDTVLHAGGMILDRGLGLVCKCIRFWEDDRRVEGTHSMTPVTCDEYVKALKTVLAGWLEREGRPDREMVLVTREVLGIDRVREG